MGRSRSRSPINHRRDADRDRRDDRRSERDLDRRDYTDRDRDRRRRDHRDRERDRRDYGKHSSDKDREDRYGGSSSGSRRRSPIRSSGNRDHRRDRNHDDNSSSDPQKKNAVPDFLMQRKPVTEEDLADKNDEEIQMMKLMGFGSFDSTKGKKVPGNDVSGVHVIQKRKYRQYMNRKGGFNRPLDFVA